MKKRLILIILIGATFGFLCMPSEIQYNTIQFFINKEKSPIANIFQNSVIKPIQSLCIFQTSELAYSGAGKPTPNSSCFVKKSILDKKIAAGLPLWAKQQIQEDLASFKAISAKDLEQIYNEHNTTYNSLVRFKIKNGKVTRIADLPLQSATAENQNEQEIEANKIRSLLNRYFVTLSTNPDPRSTAILYALEYLADNGYIKNTDFILGLNDYVTVTSKVPLPIFTFSKDLSIPIEKNLILIPDWQNLGSTPDLSQKIRNAKSSNLWDNKLDILFWRGGLNDSSGFRAKLVDFSKDHPQQVDAKFLSSRPEDKENRFVAPEDHLKYKYLISIDGARASWERLIWHLHSNSLVFKHQSDQIQWFYKGIMPNVHYISVTDEQSVLKEMAWAKTHPKEVQQIIHNASNFVDQNLEIEDLYHYILVLLQEYNKKIKEQT